MMADPYFSVPKSTYVQEEKRVLSSNILLHSRAVVEKQDFVSTGFLSYAEGDLIEIEMSEYKQFDLGEPVKLTIYSPEGMFILHSTIIAKDSGFIVVINPPENQKKFLGKRKNPRVNTDKSGWIHALHSIGNAENRKVLNQPISFIVNNISVSGIGFTLSEQVKLLAEEKVELEIDLHLKFPCVAEIVHSDASEAGLYYGASFVDLTLQKQNTLRAFILGIQIENLVSHKVVESAKRKFK
jgi:c-di-GMP-binding flagellar brake protein YcgR